MDLAAPALHAVAPVVRRHRRVSGTHGRWWPARRHAAGVLPRGRRGCAFAGRAARPSARHVDLRTVAGRDGGRQPHWRGGARTRGHGTSRCGARGVHRCRGRAGGGLQPGAARWPAAQRRHVRAGVGSLPAPHRLLRPDQPLVAACPGRGRCCLRAVIGATTSQHPGVHASPKGGLSGWDGDAERRQPSADRRARAAHTAGAGRCAPWRGAWCMAVAVLART